MPHRCCATIIALQDRVALSSAGRRRLRL